MYYINMFGSGIRYSICKIPMVEFKQFEKIHYRYNEDYENIFFDLELLNKMGYEDWTEIHTIHSGRGFIIKERNSIEIKYKTKRLKKFDSRELLYEPLIIDPYNLLNDTTNYDKSNDFKLIALCQFEIGSFYKFKLDVNQFDINQLCFNLNHQNLHHHIQEQFITNLTYDGANIAANKEDVVCTKQKVIFL